MQNYLFCKSKEWMLRIGDFKSFWEKVSQEITLYRQKKTRLGPTCARQVKAYIDQRREDMTAARVSSRVPVQDDWAQVLDAWVVGFYDYHADLSSKTIQASKQSKGSGVIKTEISDSESTDWETGAPEKCSLGSRNRTRTKDLVSEDPYTNNSARSSFGPNTPKDNICRGTAAPTRRYPHTPTQNTITSAGSILKATQAGIDKILLASKTPNDKKRLPIKTPKFMTVEWRRAIKVKPDEALVDDIEAKDSETRDENRRKKFAYAPCESCGYPSSSPHPVTKPPKINPTNRMGATEAETETDKICLPDIHTKARKARNDDNKRKRSAAVKYESRI